MKVLCLILFVTFVSSVYGKNLTGPNHDKVVVCYVASRAVYREGDGMFTLEDIEPALCTHLVYAFAGLNETTNTIQSLDPAQDLETDGGNAGYKRLVNFKQNYPHLKVTLSIGGRNESSLKYSNMASKPETRSVFIQSVLLMLNTYKFDGLDLDWEYPTKRDVKPYDRENFVLLVKELKEAFEPHGYILTAALGADKATMETAYDLAKLSKYLHFIHMKCFDYHGFRDGVVGPNAPIRAANDSVEATIDYLLSHGVSPYKMVLGLPMYGRTFTLRYFNDLYAYRTPYKWLFKVKPTSFSGPYTAEDGFIGYNEVCASVDLYWHYFWDKESTTSGLQHYLQFISYDNGRSMATKVKLAIDKGLGGVMAWSIDTDDFRGVCNETDAYVDFVHRYRKMVHNPLVNKTIKNLNLPDETQVASKTQAYVVENGKLRLRLPEQKYPNYPLLQTINGAISLAVQEKPILDEIKRLEDKNEVPTEEADDPKVDNASDTIQNNRSIICLFLCAVALWKL